VNKKKAGGHSQKNMNVWLAFFLASVIGLFIIAMILLIMYYITVYIYLPITGNDVANMLVTYAVLDFFATLAFGLFLIPSTLISASIETLSQIRENLLLLLLLMAASTGAFVWLSYHDQILQSILVARQCGWQPFISNVILPIANIARMLYDVVIQVVNFWASLAGFAQYGAPIILFSCAESNISIANVVSYLMSFFNALFLDFQTWIMAGPLTADWDISNGLDAFADIFTSAIPTLDCFCLGLHSFWVYLSTLAGLEALNSAINFTWISFINVFQLPFQIITTPGHAANFTNLTVHSCAAVESAGEFIEEALFLTAEDIWGLISSQPDLPTGIAQALSIRWTSIITHPVCGVFRLVNMTLVAATNAPAINAANGTGVAYFEFGQIVDEFKVAAFTFGEFFGILSPEAQALVTASLYATLDVPAFLLEWVIGNIFFGLFGGPLPASFGLFNVSTAGPPTALRFWRYYFVDYWFKAIPFGTPIVINGVVHTFPIKIGNYTYSSALDDFFNQVVFATQSLASIIGLFNVVLGQLIRHAINVVLGFLKFALNAISYSFCVLTFVCDDMPITARNVDLQYLYNESLLFAGAAGDLFRQFDNASCTSQIDEVNKTTLCMLGNVVETSIDVIVLTVQQVTNFLQDILTVPTRQLRICLFETTNVSIAQCVRVPDLTQAITELDDALCDFSYAVTALVPFSTLLNCTFAPINGTDTFGFPLSPAGCGRVQTCLGNVFCQVLRFIPVVLQIINQFFIKIVSGTAFTSFQQFLEFAVGLLVNQFANVLEQFGLFLDCVVCALKGAPPEGCPAPIYNVLKPIGDAFRSLAKIFTNVFLTFVKIFLLFIVGLFSGNPVDALIQFVLSFLKDILVAIGSGLVDIIARLLDQIGLGFLGSFIQVLYKGLCILLQKVINAIIGVLKVITFNHFPYDYVEFCCTSSGCTAQLGSRKRGDMQLFGNGTVMVNFENWMQLIDGAIEWPELDACNTSLPQYQNRAWSSLSDYEKGDTMFCFAKLMWAHRDDDQSPLGNSTCDALVYENMNQSFMTLPTLEKHTLIDCMLNRLYTETFRHAFQVPWIPQDILTSPSRKLYFGLELINGLAINAQFMSDTEKPPSIILSPAYQATWANMGLSTALYQNLSSVDDVVAFKQRIHLRQYFEANNASQYNATLALSTGFWSFGSSLLQGLKNLSRSFSDNETDAGIYLSYNYTLDNSIAATTSSVWSMMADMWDIYANLTAYWANPENYKKRDEAYESWNYLTQAAYNESTRQLRMMSVEWLRNKQYESENYYNQSCPTQQACAASGVTAFREAYEASMNGEDEEKGATSIVYKLSTWWEKSDWTTYPIKNPRYKDHRIKLDQTTFTYKAPNGSLLTENRWQRFTRFVALIRQGTPASQRRWAIRSAFLTRTRDKIYTVVLRRYYKQKYVETTHHLAMQERYQREVGATSKEAARVAFQPKAETTCRTASECFTRYMVQSMEYDRNHFGVHNKINTSAVRVLNPVQFKANQAFADVVFRATQFFEIPCLNNITFPCTPPLQCNGNTTTNLCEQCLYLQGAADRAITALDQSLDYYQAGGRFSQSLAIANAFFNYTFDPNVRVIVGESPNLNVRLFPAQGNGFQEFLINSAAYIGDNTPNKLRFHDFVSMGEAVLDNITVVPIQNSTLFTSQDPNTINGMVFSLVSQLFPSLLNFFYNLYLIIINGGISTGEVSYLADTFIFCDWLVGNDFSGVNKRFAIGEILAIYAVSFILASAFFVTLFGFDIVMLLIASGVFLIALASSFLTLYANWSFLCFPGLPVIFADDIMYFLAYVLFPKCSWLWGFMMTSVYDNTNCASCEVARAATLTNCVRDNGFFDFSYNVGFTLRTLFPEVIDFLANSQFRLILQVSSINDRLNAFNGVNLADPFVWAQYQGCNWITTGLPNFLIFSIFIAVVLIAVTPFIFAAITILAWLWELLAKLWVIILYIIWEIFSSVGLQNVPYYPPSPDDYDQTPDQDEEEEEEEEEEPEPETTSTNLAARLTSFLFNTQTPKEKRHMPAYPIPSKHGYSKKPHSFDMKAIYDLVNAFRRNYDHDKKRK
jgi:hypothetical protein